MTYKRIDTSEYPKQLAQKADRVKEMFRPFHIDEVEVFESPSSHYRMRAEFRVWHEGDDLYYIMFNPETREKIRMDEFIPGSLLINRLMKELMTLVRPNDILRRKLFQVDFLTTTTDEAIISLLYHRPLDDEWEKEATKLHDALASIAEVEVIGRARKQKRVLYKESVTEEVRVDGKSYLSLQTENSFTQPNAVINQKMISWAKHHVGNNSHDLLELYCGNGNFTLPLAENFNRVLATEISKSSVAAARENAELNGINNVTVVRMSAEEFTAALSGELKSRRAADADIHSFDCKTVLVDPPRAGLDTDTVKLVSQYQRIVYISCNPTTLIENIEALSGSHKVTAAAMFDQFPYTDHIETGVVMEKKN
ncbi:tRNA (uridine(54)-C5)-methyltransferase TrmA [Idiomarina sp. HP20-50]|uniref:tRNA (uridine(54)-C5)-methyltransferase TrmA n=1 Tax=Idiomarina sp. HP20-50 TaxID=3070813 RepID=UPI00294ADB2C|nr:tRNA (uridine(54)-C5)-methyltransferase TrmA [Idiomarina sp. HP20-50]MDV6316833.1 tRNA (uridine(54)-C5)-methyltransferase TrmA [Idiomarina sp. HP20-50]